MSFSKECAKIVCEKWDRYQMYRIWRDKNKELYQDPITNEFRLRGVLTEEQKNEIDTFYQENYGEKINHGWHRVYTGITGIFDKTYFPKTLYFPEFERFENLHIGFSKSLVDKNFVPLLAKGLGIRMPRMLLNCTSGAYRDENNRLISRIEVERRLNQYGEVVIKPSVESGGGKNISLICMKEGVNQYSGKTIENILEGYGDNFVVQERLRSHESLRKIYPESINNFRIVSYRWRDEIRICPAYLRIGHGGSFVDNVCSGGFSVGIDDEGRFVGSALCEKRGDCIVKHPDTGLIFAGYTVPGFVKILATVRRIHENIPQLGCCNWDFTLDEEEVPVMIEMNTMSGGGPDSIQRLHARGCFGDNTADILRWLRVMKKTPLSKRKQYMFGYGMD